jgi:hypothetical protein
MNNDQVQGGYDQARVYSLQETIDWIYTRGHKFFKVAFIRRGDGQLRVMRCRLGVYKGVKGTGPAYNAPANGLIRVFDMDLKDYRHIPVEGIRRIMIDGFWHEVTPVVAPPETILIINPNESKCGYCGEGCDYTEKSHKTLLGYTAPRGARGCGAVYTRVGSDYVGQLGEVGPYRPDLQYVPPEEVPNYAQCYGAESKQVGSSSELTSCC